MHSIGCITGTLPPTVMVYGNMPVMAPGIA